MCEDLPAPNIKHNVTQLAMSPEDVELSESDLWVFLTYVRHTSWRAAAVQENIHPFDGTIDERINLRNLKLAEETYEVKLRAIFNLFDVN